MLLNPQEFSLVSLIFGCCAFVSTTLHVKQSYDPTQSFSASRLEATVGRHRNVFESFSFAVLKHGGYTKTGSCGTSGQSVSHLVSSHSAAVTWRLAVMSICGAETDCSTVQHALPEEASPFEDPHDLRKQCGSRVILLRRECHVGCCLLHAM
jgi:hypothetical protein